MGRYRLVVLSDPTSGQDAEYNEWYDNQHLGDVVAVPGFSSAQRFRRVIPVAGDIGRGYMAIYDMDADTPEDAVAQLSARSNTELMPLADAIDMESVIAAVYEVCSPVVEAKD